MAGSSNFIPSSDSFNPFFLEALLNDSQSNLLADVSNNAPISYSSLLSQNPLEVDIPPSASMIRSSPSPLQIQYSVPTVTNINTSEAGPSRRPVERCSTMSELMGSTRPAQLRGPTPSLLETTKLFSCGCCHVLREIIHTDGTQYHKLEVHGRIGIICHAVFHQDVLGGASRPQMFDFGKKNMDEIKYFLENYCLNQKSLGYDLVFDPLSSYYEALCVGLEWTKTQNEPLGGSFPTNTNITSKGKEPEVINNNPSVSRPSDSYRSRAEQNLRSESMSINDLRDFFHLPQQEAAIRVRLCKNVLMKICRKGGIKNWPYVKVRGIMRQIAYLRSKMSPEDPVSRATTETEINRLRREMINACGGVVPTVALDT